MTWKILHVMALVFVMLLIQGHVNAAKEEYPVLVKDPTAVCLDGTPAAYYHILGFGKGANNWLVDLEGGAWCGAAPAESCLDRSKGPFGSSAYLKPINYFNGILSSDETINPDYFNWNKVYIHYCDGSSFLGDTEIANSGPILQLRGSRIFNAVMDELLKKGMGNADHAMLTGFSAGGLASILHCDAFSALLPNVGTVKCVSDSGFFIHAKDLPDAYYRETYFKAIVDLHNLTSFLPVSCTSRMNSSLCLFPEYLVGDISTPLFLLNSDFDSYQIQKLLQAEPPANPSWEQCNKHANAKDCTPTQIQLIKDFGNAFLEAIKEIGNSPSRGMFINSCYHHIYSGQRESWNSITSPRLENKTIVKAVGDWFFDRSAVQLIDNQTEFPLDCQLLQ